MRRSRERNKAEESKLVEEKAATNTFEGKASGAKRETARRRQQIAQREKQKLGRKPKLARPKRQKNDVPGQSVVAKSVVLGSDGRTWAGAGFEPAKA